MNTQELLQIFSQFTREDWIEFDRLRNVSFQPTEQELIDEQNRQNKIKYDTISYKLNSIGFTYPEVITNEFVLQLLEAINAKELVGEDLQGWVDNQIQLFGDLKTAFDDLVYNRL